jgi:glutamate dehydrogenase (NAD(P)+)
VEPGPIFETISTRLRENTTTVLATSRSRGTTPHQAARMLAQERVAEAMRLRGRMPRTRVSA